MINQYRFSRSQFSVEFFEFALTGSDVLSFLDSQTTYDVNKLSAGDFHLTTFLNPQGKVETYGWLLKEESNYLYLVPPKLEEQTRSRLNKFLVSEDVEISETGLRKWFFQLGGTAGHVFDEPADLTKSPGDFPNIDEDVRELWRKLNGGPSFDGSDFSPELVTNLRLFDLAVTMNKGCYPGQETVSKIATRRGAAYSPVLLETSASLPAGTIKLKGNKIGTASESLSWNDRWYTPVELLRDFRVSGMKLNFEIEDLTYQGVVRYYPLLPGSPEAKATELYDDGLTAFRNDDLKKAEACLRKAIELDQKLADAYEALGVMLGRQERFAEAIGLMQQLAEIDPDSTMAHTNLSLFLMKTGKIEEAENHKSLATLKSFKRFGDEAKERDELAKKAEEEKREWARREKMFQEVLEIDPEDTLANYGLGSLAVEKAEWGKARDYLERVLEADPKYSVAYLALGRAYKGLGDIEKARSTFDKGIAVAAARGDFMPANQMQSELDRL